MNVHKPSIWPEGKITKLLQVAVNDCEAGRITKTQLLSIFQEAIDNGDILEEGNNFCVVAYIIPLIDTGVIKPSTYSSLFEQRMNQICRDHLATRQNRRWWQFWKK